MAQFLPVCDAQPDRIVFCAQVEWE